MNTIPLIEIAVGDRQRREFAEGPLNELAHSISARGLLHPIVLRNDSRTLVCGERRMRAIELLHSRGIGYNHGGAPVPLGDIPYTTLADLSENDARLAELEENVIRVDLTMPERVAARAALDRALETAAREHSTPHTQAATAAHVFGDTPYNTGWRTNAIKRARLIDDHLSDPDVAHATSEDAAVKVIAHKLETQFNARLAAQGTSNRTPHTLLHGDALEHMVQMPDASFDVILADPPYGIDADTSFGDMAQLSHGYRDDRASASRLYAEIAREGFRLAKPKAHAYAFCDLRDGRFEELVAVFTAAGWSVWPWPLIWFKGTMGLEPHPGRGPRRAYEAILFAIKGDRPVTASYLDVVNVPNIKNKLHAAQKPIGVYTDLLQRSTRPGNTVLDPTCGSGTVFLAADALHLLATGIELDETSYNLALQRMTRTCADAG